MGIIGKGIKYGGLFMVAREGLKAVEKHNENKRAQQQPQPTPYAYQQPPYAQQPREMQSEYQYQDQTWETYPQPQQSRGVEGTFHQVWCNGQCEGRCGAKEALMGLQQPQQGYRDEKKAPPPY
jgi:hypothetical protein